MDYRNGIDPCINLTAELDKLGKLKDAEHQLLMLKTLSINADDYKVNNIQKLIGIDKNLESGDTARYYLSDKKSKTHAYTYDVMGYCKTAKELRVKLVPTFKEIIASNDNGKTSEISAMSVTRRNKMKKKLIQI